MNYIVTNIRIPEDDYLRLKQDALLKRISFSEAVRRKLADNKPVRTKKDINAILRKRDVVARRLGRKLQGFDVVKAIRHMRDERHRTV